MNELLELLNQEKQEKITKINKDLKDYYAINSTIRITKKLMREIYGDKDKTSRQRATKKR